MRSSTLAEHLAQPICQIVRSFPASKVPSFVIEVLEDDWPHSLAPFDWHIRKLNWEVRNTEWYVDITLNGRNAHLGIVQGLVVDVGARVRTRTREDVQADPEADLIVGPRQTIAVVAPVLELVVDPCEETYG